MKKIAAITMVFLMIAGVAYAKSYDVTRKAGDYTVDIRMDKNPPVVGANKIEIVVKDAAGKAVTDAMVLVDYGMPAMPGHPAMGYKTDAQLKGGVYQAVLNISMKGPWTITVRITRAGKAASAKFTIDV